MWTIFFMLLLLNKFLPWILPNGGNKNKYFRYWKSLRLAKKHKVRKTIVLSTDKSAYPTNVMGMTKGLAEKVMIASSRNLDSRKITFCATRYGNVMGSRGSVILFINQIKNSKDLTITDPNMARFMMSLDNAVDLVLYAFKKGNNGDIFVQKSPAVTIGVGSALIDIFNSKSKIKLIGVRHGEKMHETLITKEEITNCEDLVVITGLIP